MPTMASRGHAGLKAIPVPLADFTAAAFIPGMRNDDYNQHGLRRASGYLPWPPDAGGQYVLTVSRGRDASTGGGDWAPLLGPTGHGRGV